MDIHLGMFESGKRSEFLRDEENLEFNLNETLGAFEMRKYRLLCYQFSETVNKMHSIGSFS